MGRKKSNKHTDASISKWNHSPVFRDGQPNTRQVTKRITASLANFLRDSSNVTGVWVTHTLNMERQSQRETLDLLEHFAEMFYGRYDNKISSEADTICINSYNASGHPDSMKPPPPDTVPQEPDVSRTQWLSSDVEIEHDIYNFSTVPKGQLGYTRETSKNGLSLDLETRIHLELEELKSAKAGLSHAVVCPLKLRIVEQLSAPCVYFIAITKLSQISQCTTESTCAISTTASGGDNYTATCAHRCGESEAATFDVADFIHRICLHMAAHDVKTNTVGANSLKLRNWSMGSRLETRYTQRLIPVSVMACSTYTCIERVARRLLQHHFDVVNDKCTVDQTNGPKLTGQACKGNTCNGNTEESGTTQRGTFAIRLHMRYHTPTSKKLDRLVRHNGELHDATTSTESCKMKPAFQVERNELLRRIASIISPPYKVDLTGYDKLIVVEIHKKVATLSVLGADYDRLKRYNIAEL